MKLTDFIRVSHPPQAAPPKHTPSAKVAWHRCAAPAGDLGWTLGCPCPLKSIGESSSSQTKYQTLLKHTPLKKNTHFKIRHLDTMLIFSGHFHGISAGFPKKSNWYNCRIPATKTGCFSKRDTFLTTGFHINSDGRRYCPSARWKSIVSHVRSVQNP